MRITSQSVTEPSTAAAKLPATPTAPANFGATFAVASESAKLQVTHNAPDRSAEKKSDRTKTADADAGAPSPQIPAVQLAGLMMPASTLIPILGLPDSTQITTPPVSGQGDGAASEESSKLSGSQALGTVPISSASTILEAMPTSIPSIANPATGLALVDNGNTSGEVATTMPLLISQAEMEPAPANVPMDLEIPSLPNAPDTTGSPNASPQRAVASAGTSAAASRNAEALGQVAATNTQVTSAPQRQSVAASASSDTAAIATQGTSADQNVTAAPTSISTLPAPSLPAGSNLPQNFLTPNSLGKPQTPNLPSKEDTPTLAALSSKDRSTAADTKGKRKLDDADLQLSSASASGTPSDAKPAGADPQFGQEGSGQQPAQHLAGSEAMLQQALQASVSVTSATSHTTPQSVDSTTVGNAALATPQSVTTSNGEVAASTAVNSAQLVQSIHQSDMRLGMYSHDLGAISIDTSLNHQVLSAQISTDHTELGRALAMHLPSIEEKLGNAYGIHAKVEVRDSSTASYGDSSQQQSQSQQAKGSRQGQSQGGAYVAGAPSMLATMTALSSSPASVASDARLDIRI